MSAFRMFERASRAKDTRGRSVWETLKFQRELMEKITVRFSINYVELIRV